MTEAPSRDERAVVAIDCDEVLAQFVPALAEWHNAEHGTSFQGYSCFKTYRSCPPLPPHRWRPMILYWKHAQA
jgi:hypothetical protein